MRIFVTGAGGFLGSAVVRKAADAGHEVVALTRTPLPRRDRVVSVAGDVRDPEPWAHELAGADCVIHLAFRFGDPVEQWDVAVEGTRALLDAMERAAVRRLVLVSSMSVYDYGAIPIGATLDESCAVVPESTRRDDYTRAKRAQETLVGGRRGLRTTIVRPGAVYGPDELWDGGAARALTGSLAIGIAPDATMKLTYVENCASAIVLAATTAAAEGAVVDIVDDDLPTHREFAAALRHHGLPAPRRIDVPYRVARTVAVAVARLVALTGRRVPLPEVLDPARLDARFKPLRYSNARAEQLLGWRPAMSLDDALADIARRRR
jgi:nucleoside-diphosphate-sugar epimerase